MIHRIALLLGGIAAAGVLVFGLVRGGQLALGAPPDGSSTSVSASAEPSPVRDDVATIYIAAPQAPEVVQVAGADPGSAGVDPAGAWYDDEDDWDDDHDEDDDHETDHDHDEDHDEDDD